MDLRNLAFRVQFDGDESLIVKTDKAMDELAKTAGATTEELGKTSDEIQNLGSKKSMSSVDKLKGATKKLGEAADKSAKKLREVEKSFGKVGKNLTKKVTLPLAGLGAAGTKMALDLDHGIKKVTTLADSEILPISKIQKEVRAISDASGIAQTEIADAAYSALSAGVDSANVMEFVRSGIDLTRAGFTDMETAIDATTTVLNAYGDDAFEISKIHDIFVQTQDKGKISVDELGKSIGRVIPTASSLGVNMDQLGASYAILTAKGQNAQLATTNLNSMLDELGKTGSNADKVLREKTGKGFVQLTDEGKNIGEVLGILDDHAKATGQSLKDMFGSGTAGSAAVTLLSEGVEGFNNSLADMDGATGKTAENAKTMEDGWIKIQKAMTQAKNALMDVGAMIAPYVEMGATAISGLVEKFNALDEDTKSTIVQWGALAIAAGPVISGIGKIAGITAGTIDTGMKLAGGIGKVAGLMQGPLSLAMQKVTIGSKMFGGNIKGVAGLLAGNIPLAIGLAVVAGIALYKNWDKIKEGASKAWGAITKVVEGAVGKIKGFWQGLKDSMKNPIKGTVNIFKRDKGTKTDVDGSHSSGLGRVPFDGYVAELHRNEEILTADDPRNINNYKTTNTSNTQTTTSNPSVVYSPTFNIEIKGDATEQEVANLEQRMKKAARESFAEFFYELGLQMP